MALGMDRTAIAVPITEMNTPLTLMSHLNHIQTQESFLGLPNILFIFAVQNTAPAGWIQYKLSNDRMGIYPADFRPPRHVMGLSPLREYRPY